MMQIDNWSSLLLDSISTGICIIDRNYQVVYWNEYLETYTGVSSEDILGLKIGEFFPSFLEPKYTDRIEPVFEGWPPVFFSSRLNTLFHPVAHEKEITYQDVTITALLDKDELNFYAVITVEDVSDLNRKLEERNQLYKKAQDEIEFREKVQAKLIDSEIKLLELNKTKDKLFSIIGHDLRSPISSLLGYLNLLDKSYERYSDTQRQEMIQILLNGTKQTFNLLENLLSWAKSQSNEAYVNPEVFDIDILIKESVEAAFHIANEKQLHLNYVCGSFQPVIADRQMAQTVIRNLLSNAMKFTHSGGTITMSCETIDTFVKIQVSDTGVGMSPKVLENLFKIDYNKSTPGTNNESGTGLGLILCNDLILKNNGELEVVSEVGKGSTFTVKLPAASKSD